MTGLSIKRGRTEKPKGFLTLLVLMEQERHVKAVLGCAEGLYVRGEGHEWFWRQALGTEVQ